MTAVLKASVLERPSQGGIRVWKHWQRKPWAALACLLVIVSPSSTNAQSDWKVWRGPNGNNVVTDGGKPPVSWSETTNVAWKAIVPGRGHSSPIVVGERVLLTTADEQAQVQSVLCFHRKNGELIWKTDVNKGGFPAKIHNKNTHASPTLACDGERVFACFLNHDQIQLTALTLDGKQVWQKAAGPYRPRAYQYGYAASPLLYKNMIITAVDVEDGGAITALDQKTGRQIWKTPRPSQISYSSPIVANVAGKDQLLISGIDVVASYNPQNGKPTWYTPGTSKATCGTMIWEGDLVFASGGYPKAETIAVSADGSGKVAWRNSEKCYEQSMLVHDGHLYAVNDNGIALCWNAKTGTEQWKVRMSGPVSASPVLANGNIYHTDERGKVTVFQADPAKLTIVSENQLGDEAFATPTISGNQIFIRAASRSTGSRVETLYCLEE